jgi:hypothetical protein
MLKEIWKNRKQIAEGIKNSIIRDEFVEEVAEDRTSICFNCPNLDKEGSSCMVPKTQPCCSLCGCSLSLKTRSLSSECPDGHWPALLNEEQEDALDRL